MSGVGVASRLGAARRMKLRYDSAPNRNVHELVRLEREKADKVKKIKKK